MKKIHEELVSRGHDPFFDREKVRPGQGLTPEIEKGLRRSKLFVVHYSSCYAISHSCQLELIHAFLSDEAEGGESRILVINPEKDRAHIQPVALQDKLYIEDRGQDVSEIVDEICARARDVRGTFPGINVAVTPPRIHGMSPTVDVRVRRHGDMWRVRTALTRNDFPITQRPVNRAALLTGLPGAGKSTLVDDYILYFGHLYDDVWKLDLRGVADYYPDEIERLLGVRDRGSAMDSLGVKRGHRRQLWVVDTIPPDLTDRQLDELIMPLDNVDTILVSQGGPASRLAEEVRLDGLSPDEAVQLVKLYHPLSSEEEDELPTLLARSVSRHPMALAALARGARERSDLGSFAEQVGRVYDGAEEGIEAIVTVVADRLGRETNPDCLTLLQLAAECALDAIPVRFACAVADRFDLDEHSVVRALRRLRDSHQITWEGDSWSAHALVRLAARRLPCRVPANDLVVAAARLLTSADTPLDDRLLPHARHLCGNRALAPELRELLLTRTAATLVHLRRPEAAARFYERLLAEFPAAGTAATHLAAARCHAQVGEHERAVEHAREAGERLDALLVLAASLDAGGRFAEADPVWENVITDPVISSWPDGAAAEIDWVRSRRLRGDLLPHRQRLVAILEREDELPARLAHEARLELAEIDMLTDRPEDARDRARFVVDYYENANTPHDPVAAQARFTLASADITLGFLELKPDLERWPAAEKRLRAQLVDQEKVLGPRNLSTLTTRTAIGSALIGQGRAAAARDHARALLPVLESRVGVDHPLHHRCSYVLGMAYLQLAKFPQAIEHLESAHRGQLVTLGEAHHETLRTQFELAMALKLQDRKFNKRANALIDRVRVLSPKVTGRLNDLYAQSWVASIIARFSPTWLLRSAHRANHKHKWTDKIN
ncbi:TIR domain-containing protein [Lentzea aerocolonigenes]|nr:TIR domain-containing protein [Lentzea aerocolonigenes]